MTPEVPRAPFDLLKLPVAGRFLRWRHSRTAVQSLVLLLAIAAIADGFWGPRLAPKNLATTLVWIHFRGLLIFTLLCAGNFFCFACPFVLARDAARRLWSPRLEWPRVLRNKWTPIALFGSILFFYERFSLWASPWWTAALAVGYFGVAVAIDVVFKHASFCKFVCPIGQFNFVASLVSPLEVKVRSESTCESCRTKDCIRGRRAGDDELVTIQRGCELALFQPLKTGNMDCTFCLDCVHACPYDNVGILSRVPGLELASEARRSGIGRFERRYDIAALTVIFAFGALFNAFGMIGPAYRVERAIESATHVPSPTLALAVIAMLFLVVAPAVLIAAASQMTPTPGSAAHKAARFSYALAPIGAGMWLAHYGFHFLTGLLTIVPLTESAFSRLGWPIVAEPNWMLAGIPTRFVWPLQFGFLLLGLIGSLVAAYLIAEKQTEERATRAVLPWATLCVLLWAAAMWIMSQPMNMRGTIFSA